MISPLFPHIKESSSAPREGDLYKEISFGGHNFRLTYGYYAEFEREGWFNEPMPIYPDLMKEPRYTEEGVPLATAIQDVCEEYKGAPDGDSCSDCAYFRQQTDLFGFCYCLKRRRDPARTEVTRDA